MELYLVSDDEVNLYLVSSLEGHHVLHMIMIIVFIHHIWWPSHPGRRACAGRWGTRAGGVMSGVEPSQHTSSSLSQGGGPLPGLPPGGPLGGSLPSAQAGVESSAQYGLCPLSLTTALPSAHTGLVPSSHRGPPRGGPLPPPPRPPPLWADVQITATPRSSKQIFMVSA